MLQAHRVAMRFGNPDVGAFLDSINAPQFFSWIALNNVDPYGGERADLNAAIVAATVAQTASKKRVKVSDFMPDWTAEKKTTNPGDMAAMLSSLFKGKT